MSALELENLVAPLSSEIKLLFLNMKQYMEQKLNELVNECRNSILSYAKNIKGTQEFYIIDQIMYKLFIEYSK